MKTQLTIKINKNTTVILTLDEAKVLQAHLNSMLGINYYYPTTPYTYPYTTPIVPPYEFTFGGSSSDVGGLNLSVVGDFDLLIDVLNKTEFVT